MRIALVYLPKPYLKRPDAQAHLGLLYLAAAIEQDKRHEVTVHNVAAHTPEEALAELEPAEAYGITATSMELPQAGRFAALLKQRFPEAWTLLGGPGAYQPELVPREHIDSVVIGEAEQALPELLSSGTRPGIVRTTECQDLDALPLPARHLLDHQGGDVFVNGRNYMGEGSTVILASRGCVHKCAFCASPTMELALRFRSPEAVADEMRHVIDRHGIRQFRFSDELINSSRKRILAICEAVGKVGVAWRISCRVKPLDHEILEALSDAGCREISFGVESFDDAVLQGFKKGTTAADNARALELSFQHGFVTRVLMMIRTPHQTKDTIRLNKEAIQRLPFGVVSCKGFVPLPGSDVWSNPATHGVEILSRDLDDYNFYIFGPEGRRPLPRLIRQIDRPLDEFQRESEEFLDWLEDSNYADKG